MEIRQNVVLRSPQKLLDFAFLIGAAAILLGINTELSPEDVAVELIQLSTPNKVINSGSPNRLLFIGGNDRFLICLTFGTMIKL